MPRIILFSIFMLLIASAATSFAGETVAASGKQPGVTATAPAVGVTPLVVIYTISTCSHCMEAKEYLADNKIPFINREVDTNDENMAALIKIYDSMGVPEEKRGVPFFVIGNRINIQGFNSEKLQNALKEVTVKPK